MFVRPAPDIRRRVLSVGRAVDAYLRGAYSAAALSGPRSPHLELRTTSREGAEFDRGRGSGPGRRCAPSSARVMRLRTRGLDAIEAVLAVAGRRRPSWRSRNVRSSRRRERRPTDVANADHANIVRTSRARRRNSTARSLRAAGRLERTAPPAARSGRGIGCAIRRSASRAGARADPVASKAGMHASRPRRAGGNVAVVAPRRARLILPLRWAYAGRRIGPLCRLVSERASGVGDRPRSSRPSSPLFLPRKSPIRVRGSAMRRQHP